jgi:hypothetical protein
LVHYYAIILRNRDIKTPTKILTYEPLACARDWTFSQLAGKNLRLRMTKRHILFLGGGF